MQGNKPTPKRVKKKQVPASPAGQSVPQFDRATSKKDLGDGLSGIWYEWYDTVEDAMTMRFGLVGWFEEYIKSDAFVLLTSKDRGRAFETFRYLHMLLDWTKTEMEKTGADKFDKL